jgi:two-component system, LytTR family, response regulator
MNSASTDIGVVIVDDETGACENLKNLLAEYCGDGLNLLGIANSTREAEMLVEKLTPDALFLDIEMPPENAFQFLERISPVNFEVVFVTAYDEYAIRAFKLNAVDYILKPISITELIDATRKLRERIEYKRLSSATGTSFADMSRQMAAKGKLQKLTLKDAGNIEVVDFKNILFFEAQGSYSRVMFLRNGTVREKVMSTSLSDYEELMPADLFYRIHKSFLINCQHVRNVIRDDVGQVVINSDFTLPVSRRRFGALMEFLKNNEYYNG